MTYNKIKILAHVNEAFAVRGWKDNSDAILRVSGLLSTGNSPGDAIKAIPSRFFLANGIKKTDIQPVLERVLREKDILNPSDPAPIQLLFVYAGPLDEKPLRLGAEEKQIKESLRAITDRTSIQIDTVPAAGLKDFSNAFNRYKPSILHISSHGAEDFIVLENDSGNAVDVDEDTLTTLVGLADKQLKVVVLNACDSSRMANALTKVVDVSIGMNTSIRDDAARVFAVQFYASIGEGVSVGLAFQQAKFAIKASGINETNTPVIYSKKGINPANYRL